jgi:hypothetical protein
MYCVETLHGDGLRGKWRSEQIVVGARQREGQSANGEVKISRIVCICGDVQLLQIAHSFQGKKA